jgi:hypothetical protein
MGQPEEESDIANTLFGGMGIKPDGPIKPRHGFPPNYSAYVAKIAGEDRWACIVQHFPAETGVQWRPPTVKYGASEEEAYQAALQAIQSSLGPGCR